MVGLQAADRGGRRRGFGVGEQRRVPREPLPEHFDVSYRAELTAQPAELAA